MNRTPLLLRRSAHASRWRRAASLVEFALLLPLLLFMIVFAFEMGRMALTKAVVTDAAYSAARKAAASGMKNPGALTADFREALSGAPFIANPNKGTIRFSSARACSGTGLANAWVRVTGSYPQKFALPGMGALLGIANGSSLTRGEWTITAKASVLCEVTR